MSLASSRASVGKVPVRTKVLPASGSGNGARRAVAFRPLEPGLQQALDDLDVVRLVEEGVDARRDDRADVGDLEQLVDAGRHQPAHAAEVLGQVLRGRLADVADAEAVEEPRQRRPLAPGDVGDQVGGALVAHALERLELVLGQRVDVGQRLDPPGVDQLVDDLLAQPFDVERTPAGEMEDRELALRGADETAAAAMVDRALLAHDMAGADRAQGRHAEVRHVAGARPGNAADDLGDHVAGAAHDHPVADANALPAHLEQVVQGRVRDRRSADEDRLELGHGRELAGAADLDLDRLERRRSFLRRVLLRHRPARLARLEAELVLQRAVVDLVDDAVDLVGQAVACLGDLLVEVDQPRGAGDALVLRARRQADRVERVEQCGLRRRYLPADDLAEAVGEEAERPLRRVPGVELAHDAGGGVARIDEGLLVLRARLRSAFAAAR